MISILFSSHKAVSEIMRNGASMLSTTDKLNVAVIFGGASPEHDVSVISAQQLMDAADNRKINIIPVYMDFENRFFVGPTLRDIQSFKPKPRKLFHVTFQWNENGPVLRNKTGEFTPIDCILPILHGAFGEDGRIQSYFELKGFPVTGFTASNSAIAMRKDATKTLVRSVGVDTLDHITVNHSQWTKNASVLSSVRKKLQYPVIVKPVNLGSSIGVGIAHTANEAYALIEHVLKYDTLALIEPKVNNLCEFNIAVMSVDEKVNFSAIECPNSHADLLDFKNKYLTSSTGTKCGTLPSEGMLSLSRELNPDISERLKERIYHFAKNAFIILGSRGCPRIDFLYDQKADKLWFNEINPIPGSYGFFLWEAAAKPFLFPELIDHLINESRIDTIKTFDDPVPQNAILLPR